MATRESQAGIKQLFDAEEKAKEIVANARREKNNIQKQAREEAEKEVSDYKNKRNKDFQEYSQKELAGSSVSQQELANRTVQQLSKIQEDEGKNGSSVVDHLLKYTLQVNTEYTSTL